MTETHRRLTSTEFDDIGREISTDPRFTAVIAAWRYSNGELDSVQLHNQEQHRALVARMFPETLRDEERIEELRFYACISPHLSAEELWD